MLELQPLTVAKDMLMDNVGQRVILGLDTAEERK
jgi:hypothetical protein